MTYLESIILGIIQGLTEFIPVSSTAHLTLAGRWMGLIDAARPDQWTAFIAVIQLGTLISVLVYFAQDIRGMISGIFTDGPAYLRDRSRGLGRARLGWLVIVGTVPVVVLGLAFKKVIEGSLTKSLPVIASSLIGLALLLWFAERVGRRTRSLDDTTWKDAFVVGCAQALALIPGSSRSGTTITAALFLGLRREDAARFSFLLSIPAVLASGLLELYQMRAFIGELGAIHVLAATVAAGVAGYASIGFLLRYLRTRTTIVFIVYRILAGGFIWYLLLAGKVLA